MAPHLSDMTFPISVQQLLIHVLLVAEVVCLNNTDAKFFDNLIASYCAPCILCSLEDTIVLDVFVKDNATMATSCCYER